MNRMAFLIALIATISTFGQQRIPLIEEFSASTCPPCKTFNDNVFNPFLNTANLQGKYTVVNYRANWPGSGDPYYTAEAGSRISYYAVNAVPSCFIDGKTASTGGALSSFTSTFTTRASTAPKASISAQYHITGTTVSAGKVKATVTITPNTTIANAFLYIAVVEKLTTKNALTNGEKEFHYVMMKMVPNAAGKALTLTANTPVTVTDSASLTGTKIEEMSDLAVVVWVQISGTREVIQSAFAVEGATPIENRCFLNGCSSGRSTTVVRNNTVYNAANTTITVHDLTGRLITQIHCGRVTFPLSLLGLSRGCYLVRVGSKGQTFTEVVSMTR